jgi:hypothetical protein
VYLVKSNPTRKSNAKTLSRAGIGVQAVRRYGSGQIGYRAMYCDEHGIPPPAGPAWLVVNRPQESSASGHVTSHVDKLDETRFSVSD